MTALQINPCESPAVQSIHREPALNAGLMLGIHKEIFIPSHESITPFPSPRGSTWKRIQVPAPMEGTSPRFPRGQGVLPQVARLEGANRRAPWKHGLSKPPTVSGLGGSEKHRGPQNERSLSISYHCNSCCTSRWGHVHLQAMLHSWHLNLVY